MSRSGGLWLACRAWIELVRYDAMHVMSGRRGVRLPTSGPGPARPADSTQERAICEAIVLACCFYWKPVLCLQRSTCAVRLLRAYGIPARLVIGYRPRPSLFHAWVEVDGRVVNDSPAYQERLRILHTA